MSCKRSFTEQDPDYENDLSSDQKRLKVIEKDNKEATVRKIQQIVTSQFGHEVKVKETEAKEIDDTLYQTLKMLNELRGCAVRSFYNFETPSETAGIKRSGYQPPLHPAVKKYIGKRPKHNSMPSSCGQTSLPLVNNSCTERLTTSSFAGSSIDKSERNFKSISPSVLAPHPHVLPSPLSINTATDDGSRGSRFKIKKRIVVGNVSQYIPVDKREQSDRSTHKWMVYVRGSKEEPFIETFVKKVTFFLHPSYRPNDLVDVCHPPFNLTRRGWGEFQVRIQLHFHNPRNKRRDILHMLKLDKTHTGLQTLGSETVVDVVIWNPDLSFGDVVEKSANSDASSVMPHDLGGISIPAESSTCSSETSHPNLRQPHLLVETLMPNAVQSADKHKHTAVNATREKAQEFTAILPKNHLKINVKQEKLEESVTDKFLSSFLNDHGAYFNPTNAFSTHCKPGNTGRDSSDAPNEDSDKQLTPIIPHVHIKQEPLDESADISDVTNTLSLVNPQSVKEEKADLVNTNVPGASQVHIRKENLASSLSANRQMHASSLSADILVHKCIEESKPDLPNVRRHVLKVVPNQPFDSGNKINNLPVNVIPQTSQIPRNLASSVANVSIRTPFSKPNAITALRPQSPLVSGEAKKADGQPQAGNGVATFMTCADKQGNLILIPLDMFLKMNPNAQTSILQSANAASGSSSLLKPIANSTAVGSPTNHILNASWPKAPAGNLPASGSSSTTQQSLLLNSKMPQIAQMNNRSLLLPQNSVSLLTGSQQTKSQLDAGCTSTAKTMVSCLVKSRLAASSKAQTTSETKESPSLNMDLFETMDGIVRTLVKAFPLFAHNPDRTLHPYCAPSLKDFLKWNVGKRHAAEWQRARAMQNKMLQFMPNSSRWNAVSVWSIKRLLVWCRHHGYSPMKPMGNDDDCNNEDIMLANVDPFSTYTEETQILETLNKEIEQCKDLLGVEEEEEEEEIDITTVERPKLKPTFSPEKAAVHPVIHLASTPCGDYIRESVEQIGLKLLPEEVCSDTVAPLAEEVLLAAVKQFAEEILSASVANAFKKNGNKRCLNVITPLDVANAIRNSPQWDFLTNNYLGTSIPKNYLNDMAKVNL